MSDSPAGAHQYLVAWATTSDGYLDPTTLEDGREVSGPCVNLNVGQDLVHGRDADDASALMHAQLLSRPGVRSAEIRAVVADL